MAFQNKHMTDVAAPLSPDEILHKMEHFCAYRERCPKEVRQKLAELGASGEIAAQILQVLQTDKFFDEERFAGAYARGKFRNNDWGKVKIRLELKSRDINWQIIEQALESIDESEYEAVLEKLTRKKLAQLRSDPKAFEKTAATLARAGFETELIFKKIKKIKPQLDASES